MSNQVEKVALEAANKAADIQNHYYETDLGFKHKGQYNLLTQADLESQEVIIEIISKDFPDHQILAEENEVGHQIDFSGPTWIIDPLDGTTNFAHRVPIFAISIGFMNKGEMQFGLVQIPRINETFLAHKGKGASLNGRQITVSKKENVKTSLLVTGFAYDRATAKNNNLELFGHFEMNSLSVRRLGAAAADLAFVACGRFDGFWEMGLQPWDIAAGMLLVSEAGGTVTEFSNQEITDLWCKELIATNGKIHQEIIDKVSVTIK